MQQLAALNDHFRKAMDKLQVRRQKSRQNIAQLMSLPEQLPDTSAGKGGTRQAEAKQEKAKARKMPEWQD
jgi:hypothetical protein